MNWLVEAPDHSSCRGGASSTACFYPASNIVVACMALPCAKSDQLGASAEMMISSGHWCTVDHRAALLEQVQPREAVFIGESVQMAVV